MHYSGKKKCHAVKNVLLAEQSCPVPFLSDTYEASVHDKPIADQTPYLLPAKSELLQDKGFIGFTLDGVTIAQPHKKPKGADLSEEHKAENKHIGHRRVRIEHIICSVKRLRIVKDKIRLTKDTVRDMVMEIAVGLHNFRLRLDPWPIYT